jgi:hypothetical protein
VRQTTPQSKRYIVNVSGEFGARRIILHSKYKRDQFLSLLRAFAPQCRITGYFDFIQNIANKGSKKAKEALRWYGSPYNPDDIDEKQMEIALRRIAHRAGRSKAVKK